MGLERVVVRGVHATRPRRASVRAAEPAEPLVARAANLAVAAPRVLRVLRVPRRVSPRVPARPVPARPEHRAAVLVPVGIHRAFAAARGEESADPHKQRAIRRAARRGGSFVRGVAGRRAEPASPRFPARVTAHARAVVIQVQPFKRGVHLGVARGPPRARAPDEPALRGAEIRLRRGGGSPRARRRASVRPAAPRAREREERQPVHREERGGAAERVDRGRERRAHAHGGAREAREQRHQSRKREERPGLRRDRALARGVRPQERLDIGVLPLREPRAVGHAA